MNECRKQSLDKSVTCEFLRNRYIGRPSALTKVKFTKPSKTLTRLSNSVAIKLPLKDCTHPLPQLQQFPQPQQILCTPIQFPAEPLSDPELNNPIYVNSFSIRRKTDIKFDVQLEDLKKIIDLNDEERRDLLFEKIQICEKVCDFSSSLRDKEAKEIKTQCLNDLNSLFADSNFTEIIYATDLRIFLNMIKKNIIRNKPYIAPSILIGRAPVFCEKAWAHLLPIYQIFYSLVFHFQRHLIIPSSFLKSLLLLLHFPDERERDQIVQIVLIYLRYHSEQIDFVLRCVTNEIILYYEQKHEGFAISSFLKIIFAFISRAIPFLKPFQAVLAPLLSCSAIDTFFSLLLSIIDYIITYDKSQTLIVMYEMIHRFPISSVSAQVIRISMINKLIERLTPEEFSKIHISFFQLYARCANSRSTKVTLSALSILSNKSAIKLFTCEKIDTFQILYPFVSKAMKFHWSPKVKGPALIALKALQGISPKDFEKMHKNTSDLKYVRPNWDLILKEAIKNDKSINIAKCKKEADDYFTNIEKIAKLESENITIGVPQKTETYYF
ncbi:hypothetical protein TRFO_07897 [Tritrichomonas foetus]|uniref:Phosphoprotein phosphatase n=1 Tax=Tritrichomonas foetus TaxID=1144522 RepID=A0A1J4JSS5_9EUKA|nr:hypothetical protein TRFO_07897 [Tritrichomonas foetus]|eukprot:OHT00566.1 hypothetical protein TRFO_07897 [Tritrichomonas foetus]